MKTFKFIFPFLLFAASCGNERAEKNKLERALDSAALVRDSMEAVQTQLAIEDSLNAANRQPPPVMATADLVLNRTFVGDFIAEIYNKNEEYTYINKITICIDTLTDNRVSGFSVVAGNKRRFAGKTDTSVPGILTYKVAEPGDDKYDGRFEFIVTTAYDGLKGNNETLKGNWYANDMSIPVPARHFALEKKFFKYDPNSIIDNHMVGELYSKNIPKEFDGERISEKINNINASKQELKKEDLENMYKGDLEIIRNAIYARHGYSFKSKRMRFIFDNSNIEWYVPISIDVRNELTELEKKNIELIKVYEEHAKNYYDTFGR